MTESPLHSLNLTHPSAAGTTELTADPTGCARQEMFHDFCALLDRECVDYVILAGYHGYPERIDSDVDFMVSERDFARLPTLLNAPGAIGGARLLQMLQHETTACYYVLARPVGARLAYLHPDAAASYRRRGRLWLHSKAVLASRRRHAAGFWIPAAAVEFEYYFVKRIDKRVVEPRHVAALAALRREDPAGCDAVLSRLLSAASAAQAAKALACENATWYATNCPAMASELAQGAPRETTLARLRSVVQDLLRRGQRVRQPTGLVVAVLGPDGSGKTTVIEHLASELSPAFRRVRRFHLRPRFGRSTTGGMVSDPHAQPARPWSHSLAKIALFVADYLWSWARIVMPARARSTLVIFDRYYHDLLVDPLRYRLPRPFPPAGWAAPLVPLPDLWLVLTARPETLLARKGEVSLAEAQRMVAAYGNLAAGLTHATLVDTEGPLEETLAGALALVVDALATRAAARLEAPA